MIKSIHEQAHIRFFFFLPLRTMLRHGLHHNTTTHYTNVMKKHALRTYELDDLGNKLRFSNPVPSNHAITDQTKRHHIHSLPFLLLAHMKSTPCLLAGRRSLQNHLFLFIKPATLTHSSLRSTYRFDDRGKEEDTVRDERSPSRSLTAFLTNSTSSSHHNSNIRLSF